MLIRARARASTNYYKGCPVVEIRPNVVIDDSEISMSAIRAMGSGGQNVNKVSSAIHLKFNIAESSLPEKYKEKLLKLADSRISKDGVIVIKAQTHRTQEKNRDDALARLKALIVSALHEDKPRKATRPSLNAKRKRVDSKKRNGATKSLRKKVDF